MSPQAARRQSGLLSIGQVLARLTPEFPDLAPSKVRFFEDQGLIEPARTPSGYRKFSGADVDRLRYILTLQRDHYLPLKVILSHLREVDEGTAQQMVGTNVRFDAPSMLRQDRRHSRAELHELPGSSRKVVNEAVAHQLIPAAEPYDESAVQIVRALVELERYGIEPRHLRGMRATAEREAALIETAVKPVLGKRDSGSKARAAEASLELAGHIQAIRESLCRTAVARVNA